MNRLAGFLLTSIAGAFLLVAPKQCLAQTQLVPVKVAVPAAFRSFPFERDLYLQVPRGFQIRVVSRIRAARFLAPTPQGGVLVSQPSRGKIWWISPKSANVSPAVLAAAGLRLPHGMVFTVIGGKAYVYVSESNEISRFRHLASFVLEKESDRIPFSLPGARNVIIVHGQRENRARHSLEQFLEICRDGKGNAEPDPLNPDVDKVSFGVRIVFHDRASLPDWRRVGSCQRPLKCSPIRRSYSQNLQRRLGRASA